MSESQRRQTWAVVLILVFALGLRLLYLWHYYDLPDWYQLTVDNYYHHHWAQSIAEGNILGDTTYFRAPFYVYCLGFLYWLLGTSLWVGRLFGMTLGLTSVLMTYLIGKRMFDHRVGLTAAVIHSVLPTIVYFESELLLDPLYMLLLQLAMYRLLIWWENATTRNLIFCGLIFGLAAITRPTVLAFMPLLMLMMILCRKESISERLKATVFLALTVGLVIAPITARNLLVASDPVLIASQGGINFYIGNNRTADGTSAVMPPPMGHNWRLEDVAWQAEKETGSTLTPGELSGFWMQKGFTEIAEDPVRFAGLFATKLYRSISTEEISNNRSLGRFFSRVPLLHFNPLSFGLIFPLAIGGLILGWKRKPSVRLLFWLILSQTLLVALFFFNSRFRLPILPFYIVLASHGMYALGALWRHSQMRAAFFSLLLLAVAFVSLFPVVPLTSGASTQDFLSRALMLINRGEYDRAAETLRTAAELDDTFPTTNLNLGVCYLRKGNTDSAFYYFNREKSLHPDRPKAYINTASLHLINSRVDAALIDVRQALELSPYDITANRIMLRAAEKQSMMSTDNLMQMIVQAAERTGNDLSLLNEAAGLLMARQEYHQAESVLRKALEATPPPIETDNTAFDADFIHGRIPMQRERAVTYHLLAVVSGGRQAFGQAVEYAGRAIELNPELIHAYGNLAAGYMALGHTSRADSVLTVALRKFPDDPSLLSLRDMLYGTP